MKQSILFTISATVSALSAIGCTHRGRDTDDSSLMRSDDSRTTTQRSEYSGAVVGRSGGQPGTAASTTPDDSMHSDDSMHRNAKKGHATGDKDSVHKQQQGKAAGSASGGGTGTGGVGSGIGTAPGGTGGT